jgi:GAF domain-containing protein
MTTTQLPSPDPAWVAELQQVLVATEGLEEFLREVTERAVRALPAARACGITLRRDGRPFTVASNNEFAQVVDETQYAAGDGPCLHSLRTGETVMIIDALQERRWPAFIATAVVEGLRSSLSVPLTVPDGSDAAVGALNLYATTPAGFDETARDRARLFAEAAAGAVVLAQRIARYARTSQDLREALASRAVIDQAIGIIMCQNRCPAEEAFGILRQVSHNRNVKLREVAARLVTSVSGKPPSEGFSFSPPD